MPPETQFLKCPNCSNDRFYINLPDEKILFFKVALDKTILPTRETDLDLSELDFSRIYCTSCSWYGSMDELVA